MGNLTLFKAAEQYREAADQLQDMDLPEHVIADTLEGLAGPLTERVTAVAMVARNLDASASAIRDAIKEMEERANAVEARAKRAREYLLAGMQAAGVEKVECPYFRVSVRSNPPSVDVLSEAGIPAEYWVQPSAPPKRIDKRALLDALKAGAMVDGAVLKRGSRIEIK